MPNSDRFLTVCVIALTVLLLLLGSPGSVSAQSPAGPPEGESKSGSPELEASEPLLSQSDLDGILELAVATPKSTGGWICEASNFGNRTARCRNRASGAPGAEVVDNGAAWSYVVGGCCEAMMECGGSVGNIYCHGYQDCIARYWNDDPSTGIVKCDGVVVASCS